MTCCGSPRVEVCLHGREAIQWCAHCAAILDVQPRNLRAPTSSDLAGHMRAELALENVAARERPWVPATLASYEELTHVKALVRLRLPEDDGTPWRAGDFLEFRGIDLRQPPGVPAPGVIVHVQDGVLVVRVPPKRALARVIDAEWLQLEVRTADLTHLHRNRLKVYEALLADTDLVERLLDPVAFPRMAPRAEGPPLASVDPEVAANPEQARAYEHALRVPDGGVGLVQGPPGTGKTRLISAILRALARTGARVLVVAPTNVAVDNVLFKTLELEPGLRDRIARWGRAVAIDARLEGLWADSRNVGADLLAEDPHARTFAAQAERTPILAMTLAMLTSHMARCYSRAYERFDYAIVDEAGMTLAPAIAPVLHASRRVLLVGDHCQLPPIVEPQDYAVRPGFATSVFEQVARARPDLLARLTRQYRSLPGIMDWPNAALYHGTLQTMRDGPPPTLSLGNARIASSVAWLDTTRVQRGGHFVRTRASTGKPSFAHPAHAAIAVHVVGELLRSGYAPGDVGYISPFVLQADLFTELMRRARDDVQVEAATVDSFQGREKRVILFDVTTAEPQRSHESIKRLNVSLTRARDLLLVLGPRAFAAGPKENVLYHSLSRWFDGRPVVDAADLDAPEHLFAEAESCFIRR